MFYCVKQFFTLNYFENSFNYTHYSDRGSAWLKTVHHTFFKYYISNIKEDKTLSCFYWSFLKVSACHAILLLFFLQNVKLKIQYFEISAE